MQETDFSLLSRINRDIPDGLIVLDTKGTVIYINPAAGKLLGKNLEVGNKYAELIALESNEKNDAFHQYVIDSVYDKNEIHKGELEYTGFDGVKRIFNITASYLFGSDGKEKKGVVIQFSDVTELNKTHQLHKNTAYIFIALLGLLSFFNYLSVIWERFNRPFPSSIMTLLIEMSGLLLVLILYKNFDLNFNNMGLRVKGCGKYFLMDGIVTFIILIIMIIVKFYLRKFMILSPDEPFWHLDKWTMAETFYPVTVVLQEFLTRSLVHEGISQVLPQSKRSDFYAIVISSVFFGAMHIYLGLAFMAGAAFLLGFFGLIYRRQKSIWGLCIPHYVLGLAVTILWGF